VPRLVSAASWSPNPATPISTPGGRRGTSSDGSTRSPTRLAICWRRSRPGHSRSRLSRTASKYSES